jgi:hypothetical protein
MHGITHVAGGPDPVPGLLPGQASNYTTAIFALPELRGYWRLGEGAPLYADTSGYNPSNPCDLAVNPGTSGDSPVTEDVTPGLLPADTDDGAVGFNMAGNDAAAAVHPFLEDSDRSSNINFNFDASNPAMSVVALVRPSSTSLPFWGGVISVGYWALDVRFPTGEVQFWRGTPSSYVAAASPAGAVTAGQVSLLVATYDGTTSRVYVDGVLRASVADSSTLTTITGGSLATIRIGGYQGPNAPTTGNSVWRPFLGVIDEAAVYGSALSDADVDGLHKAATGGVAAGSVLVSDGHGGTSWQSPPPAPAVTVNGSTMPAAKTPKPPPSPPPAASGLDWISDQPFTYDGPSFTVQPRTWTTVPFATPVMARDNPDGMSAAIDLASSDAAGWLDVDAPHAITVPHDVAFLGDPSDWMQVCLRIDNPLVQPTTSFRGLRIFETTHQKTLIQVVSEQAANPCDEGGGINVYLGGSVFASGDTGNTGSHPDIFFAPNAGLAYALNGNDWLPKVSGVPTLKAGMRLVAQAWHDATVPLTFSCANTGGTYKPHFVLYISCDRAWGPPWSTWPT